MEGEFAVQLVVWVVFGGICAAIASSRGRSPVGWFFIGMAAPCIGLILVLVLPDLKVEENRRRQLSTENRRLREKLKKDRIAADQRHQETVRRLKVHDVALDLDTAPATERIEAAAAPPELPREADGGRHPEFDGKEWYYAEETEKSAPLAFAGLKRLWDKGIVDAETLVWTEGMPEWRPVGDVENLEEALRA